MIFQAKALTFVPAIVLGMLIAVSSSFAKDRPCKVSDLLGTWELTKLDVIQAPKFANMPLVYPFQKRNFGKDGKMRHFVSQTPFTPEMLKELEKTPRNVEYRVGKKGIVTIKVLGQETDYFRCAVIGKKELLFTWPESGKATLVHLFQKTN
jgi:hypothetical protein